MADRKRRMVAVGVSSLLLVAMVVALTIGSGGDIAENNIQKQDVSESQKSIQTICQPTEYKDACVESLSSSGTNSTDPKELVQIAFKMAIGSIEKAAKNSSLLEELQTDPRAKLALKDCQELANRAADDLKRSIERFSNFDFTLMDDLFADLKIWLSGAITHEQTCLDGFEDIPGDAGQKMRDFLESAMQLTSNGLAMVTEASSVLESMGLEQVLGNNKRRLLSSDDFHIVGDDDKFPDWLETAQRRFLSRSRRHFKPHLIVAKDGSGNYQTINEALEVIPKHRNKTFVLYIKEGVYNEKVQFNSSLTHLLVVGDGPTKTRITGSLNFIDGITTYHTATVAVLGDHFMAKGIGFENAAGAEKHQAVALRVGADKAVFYNCHMDGYQDTLYAHTYRQYYRNCKISGTIDFVFGDSAALFQNCILEVRKPMMNQQCIVTAQGRKNPRQPTGLVLQNCSFVADPEYYPHRNTLKSFLGRPWKEFSRTIIMESYIDDLIAPEGWLPWNGTFGLDTLFYTEFNNRGPGSNKEKRLKWSGVKELQASRVQRFTGNLFFAGSTWIPGFRVPYSGDFMLPIPQDDPNKKYSPIGKIEKEDMGMNLEKNAYNPKAYMTPESPSEDSSEKSSPSSSSKASKKHVGESAPAPAPTPIPSAYQTPISLPPIASQAQSPAAPPSTSPMPGEGGSAPTPSAYQTPISLPPIASQTQSPAASPSASQPPYAAAPAQTPTSSAPIASQMQAPAAAPDAAQPPNAVAPVSYVMQSSYRKKVPSRFGRVVPRFVGRSLSRIFG